MPDVQNLERLIVDGIKSFNNDPPDTEYQRGYLAALRELAKGSGILVPDPKHH